MSSKWAKPERDCNKINVKGILCRDQCKASVGIVMRDDEGEWLIGYAGNIGPATLVCAELVAIYNGITKSLALGFTNFVIETESEEAVSLINEKREDYPLISLIEMIDDLLKCEKWKCSLQRVAGEANEAAKFLANYGFTWAEGLEPVNAPPHGLKPILKNDCADFEDDYMSD